MANTQTPFQQGAAFFPGKLREILLAVDEVQQREAEEIRLRAGKGLSILGADGRETVLPGTAAISQQELRGVIEIATAGVLSPGNGQTLSRLLAPGRRAPAGHCRFGSDAGGENSSF